LAGTITPSISKNINIIVKVQLFCQFV
jgi:hypothetical protein